VLTAPSISHIPARMVLLAVIPLLLAASDDTWRQVAAHDVAFAKGLASQQVRYGSDFEQVVQGRVARCRKIDGKVTELDAATLRQIDLFCEHLCMPWVDAWAAALAPCESEPVPSWCDDRSELDRHIGFGPYFEVLASAVRDASDPLERYNIMAVIADRLDHSLTRDYPYRALDHGVGLVLMEYMRSASIDETLSVARLLYSSASFGRRSEVARQLRTYAAASTTLSAAQRKELEECARSVAEKP